MSPSSDNSQSRAVLEKLVAQKAPIFLPWCKAMIYLGNGFNSQLAIENKLPWTGRTAFDQLQLATFTPELRGGTATFRESTSSAFNADSSHLSASVGVTAGCDYLSVNVTGSYDEITSNTAAGSRASRHATCNAGLITFDHTPQLTKAAREALKSGDAAFCSAYGDYFVSGLQIGADAGMCLTVHDESHVHDTTTTVSVTAHALLWDATTETTDVQSTRTSSSNLSFSAYNTLLEQFDRKHCSTGEQMYGVLSLAGSAAKQIARLQSAVLHEMAECKLDTAKRVTWGDLNKICLSGLVSHVILRPYTQLPEIVGHRSMPR